MRNRWGLPLVLGVATFLMALVALWPEEEARVPVVVAARDLGSGTLLRDGDVVVQEVPAARAPDHAVRSPEVVMGQTLAVARYAGETVGPLHIGPAVALRPDERGIAIRVEADTGLAGLLRPGMTVGVVATLPSRDGLLFAKAVMDGMRVLYVPPGFQAQPETPLVVTSDDSGTVRSSGFAADIDEGVVVLAASIVPQTIRFQLPSPEPSPSEEALEQAGSGSEFLDQLLAEAASPDDGEPDPLLEVVPLELLAGLNAAGAALTFFLTPEGNDELVTPGFFLGDLMPEDGAELDTLVVR